MQSDWRRGEGEGKGKGEEEGKREAAELDKQVSGSNRNWKMRIHKNVQDTA